MNTKSSLTPDAILEADLKALAWRSGARFLVAAHFGLSPTLELWRTHVEDGRIEPTLTGQLRLDPTTAFRNCVFGWAGFVGDALAEADWFERGDDLVVEGPDFEPVAFAPVENFEDVVEELWSSYEVDAEDFFYGCHEAEVRLIEGHAQKRRALQLACEIISSNREDLFDLVWAAQTVVLTLRGETFLYPCTLALPGGSCSNAVWAARVFCRGMKEYDDLYQQACSDLLAKAQRNLIEIPLMIGRITRLTDSVLFFQLGHNHPCVQQSLDELREFDRFIRSFGAEAAAMSPIYTEPVARALAICDYPDWHKRGFRTACFHLLTALTVMGAVVRALNEVRRCTPKKLASDRGRIAWLKEILGFPCHPDNFPF